MQMPAIALQHTLFYVPVSIDLLISDVIRHTCRTETVMTFLLTLPKCSKAQVSRPALIYEHWGHKRPDDEQHSFTFKYLGFIYYLLQTLLKDISLWSIDAEPSGRFWGLRSVRSMNRFRWPCSTHPVWRKMEQLWPWMRWSSYTVN